MRAADKDTTTVDLGELAARLEAASSRLSRAEKAVETDKAARRGAWLRRLYDYLFDTAPEKELARALEAGHHARREAGAGVKVAVAAEALRLMSMDPGAARRRAVRFADLSSARRARVAAAHLRLAATSARDAFVEAMEACSSASSMEMMDVFSSSKVVSAMSHSSTSAAREAVGKATGALSGLKKAVAEAETVRAEVDMPDDFLDLVIDFAIDLPFDFLSWSNMEKLDAAVNDCGRVASEIGTLLPKLQSDLKEARMREQRAFDALAEVDGPFIAAAARTLPRSLRFAVPRCIEDMAVQEQ